MNIGSEMQEISSNNKRIAKNTLLLYFRMLVTMAVSLYTSRVVLNILGVEDFGIYNVVGGIVAMFGFINGSMTSATQRYLTFELGQNNRAQLTKVFSTSLSIHGIISFLIIVYKRQGGNGRALVLMEQNADSGRPHECRFLGIPVLGSGIGDHDHERTV